MTRITNTAPARGAATRAVVTPQRLVAAAGIACVVAAALPGGRVGGSLRWWWQDGAASAFGGFATLLAAPLLVAGSLAAGQRGLAISGSVLSIGAAAAWALAVPGGVTASLIVITALALIGCASLLADPVAWDETPALRWWTLGAALAAFAFAAVNVVRAEGLAPDFAATVGMGGTGLVALTASLRWRAALDERASPALPRLDETRAARRIAVAAVVIGLLTALAFVAFPAFDGWRAQALASARVAMLLVTGVAALGALLAVPGASITPDLAGADEPDGARGDPA